MPPQAPSPRALRALSQLIRTPRSSTSLRQPHHLPSSITSPRHKSTDAHPARPASLDNASASSPRKQPPIDPQQASTPPTLPDISSYYTLFPRTLPHGPPRALPKETSASTPTPTPTRSPPADAQAAQPRFAIDVRALRAEFLQLQRQYHPDKHTPGTPAHQQAYALSTLLNNAYRTLASPLLRAQYVLRELHGVDVTSEDNSAYATDRDTLLEVMQVQEDAEGATEREVVERLLEENRARVRRSEDGVARALEAGDVEGATREVVRLKYWVSLGEGLADWEEGREVRLTH